MKQIRNFFEQLTPLADHEWAMIEKCFHREEYSKKSIVLEQSRTCDFVAFVETGIFRFYHVREANETVTAFFFPSDFVSNYRSFVLNEPSNHFIESLEEGVIWKLRKSDLNELYNSSHTFERAGRLIAERLYVMMAKRLDSFQSETPEERYLSLLKKGSRLIQDIPQYMLASYLGISPETLSRIRKRITL